MTIFGIEIEPHDELLDFIAETNKRLQSCKLLKNPFSSESKLFLLENDLLVVNIQILYNNYAFFGAISSAVLVLFFARFNYLGWYLIPLIFLLLNFFWSKTFLFLMLKTGLRKKGYRGKIKLMRRNDLEERLISFIILDIQKPH